MTQDAKRVVDLNGAFPKASSRRPPVKIVRWLGRLEFHGRRDGVEN
jgi:hypothetical protein